MLGDQPSLFGDTTVAAPGEKIPPAYRRDDPHTSKDAAQIIHPISGKLRARVLQVFVEHPDGLTDRELERMPAFAMYGPSTVRKRRSELLQLGHLQAAGTRHGLTIWVRVAVPSIDRDG